MAKQENIALDQLKEVESKQQKALMVKALQLLKAQANAVHKAKYATMEILKQLNVNETDKKSIIDWVNSLSDVKLSDDNEIDIETEISESLKEKKKEAIKEVNDYFTKGNYFITNANAINNINVPTIIDWSPTKYTTTCLAGEVIPMVDTILTLTSGMVFDNR